MSGASWVAADLGANCLAHLPRVPRVGNDFAFPMCLAHEPRLDYLCSRPKHHTGRHAAHGTENTVHAVWGDPS